MNPYSSVPIYDSTGSVISQVELPEPVQYVSGRTSKGESGLYYKGVGARYSVHSALDPKGYSEATPSEVFYYGYDVVNAAWRGKFGIFQTRMQPYFSDFIGSCGPKELKLIANANAFDLSAVQFKGCVEYDPANNQRYFMLEYEDGARTDWVKDGGKVNDLLGLIDYMLTENWNLPWDKGAISDVSASGKVHDVADMFISNEAIHKLGTVYSLLYSMRKKHPNKYYECITTAGFKHHDNRDVLMIAVSLLERSGIDVSFAFPARARDEWDIYYHLVANCLLAGKNCGYVENAVDGDRIRQQYVANFFSKLPQETAANIKSFINKRKAA